MLTGKRFRLRFETIAIEMHGDKRIVITIPSREVIEVIQDPLPADTRMVGIPWKGRSVVVFGDDVTGHGKKSKIYEPRRNRICSPQAASPSVFLWTKRTHPFEANSEISSMA